jgi:hypothetical protein
MMTPLPSMMMMMMPSDDSAHHLTSQCNGSPATATFAFRVEVLVLYVFILLLLLLLLLLLIGTLVGVVYRNRQAPPFLVEPFLDGLGLRLLGLPEALLDN